MWGSELGGWEPSTPIFLSPLFVAPKRAGTKGGDEEDDEDEDENHRKIIGKFIHAFVCCVWVILMVNMVERTGQKLLRIILLHFGLVTFRFHYGGDRTPFMFMVFRFRTCP